MAWQTFAYDGLGNLSSSEDDLSARYDRSLGPDLGFGSASDGPDQLRGGEGMEVEYDPAGNVTALRISRAGTCSASGGSACAQWFAYDWDETGQLARARRWDLPGGLPAQEPQATPDRDMEYAYSQGRRVRKSGTDAAGKPNIRWRFSTR